MTISHLVFIKFTLISFMCLSKVCEFTQMKSEAGSRGMAEAKPAHRWLWNVYTEFLVNNYNKYCQQQYLSLQMCFFSF